jgi:hypothetical protein
MTNATEEKAQGIVGQDEEKTKKKNFLTKLVFHLSHFVPHSVPRIINAKV